MIDEYKRSCLDEIDHAKSEQQHSAVLQISKICFDFKKLCVSTLGACLVLLIKFNDNEVDYNFFIVGVIIILGFWVSDGTAYYYQKSLRNSIEKRYQSIASRNGQDYILGIAEVNLWKSMFNMSMSLYFALLLFLFISWCGFKLG